MQNRLNGFFGVPFRTVHLSISHPWPGRILFVLALHPAGLLNLWGGLNAVNIAHKLIIIGETAEKTAFLPLSKAAASPYNENNRLQE